MKKEKSCGAVIYKIEGDRILFLVLYMGLGHKSLSKGHVEGDETEVETAEREIFEETNLKPIIDTGFRKIITYSPFDGIIKDVIYFVAKSNEDRPLGDFHDDEVCGYSWLDFENALKEITYQSDKDVVKEAYLYIKGKENGKF